MILRRGMNSPDVLNVELILQSFGFQGFVADGIFDEKTENVVKYIQKSHGLKPDGVIGKKTFELLDRLYEPEVANFAPKPVTEDISTTAEEVVRQRDEELLQVHPILRRKILQVIAIAEQEGYEVTVVQGLRTFAQQDKLFRQRPKVTNAKGGQSYHNYGVAVDVAFIVDGKISWDEKLYKNIGRWASQVGLTWGGHWKFVDYPHLQLLNMPATGKLLATYNAAGKDSKGVKAVWSKYV